MDSPHYGSEMRSFDIFIVWTGCWRTIRVAGDFRWHGAQGTSLSCDALNPNFGAPFACQDDINRLYWNAEFPRRKCKPYNTLNTHRYPLIFYQLVRKLRMKQCTSSLAVIHQLSSDTLQWRDNGRDGVSNHQPHDCLLTPFIRAHVNENTKAPRHWPLWGEFTGGRWIPRTNGQ